MGLFLYHELYEKSIIIMPTAQSYMVKHSIKCTTKRIYLLQYEGWFRSEKNIDTTNLQAEMIIPMRLYIFDFSMLKRKHMMRRKW